MFTVRLLSGPGPRYSFASRRRIRNTPDRPGVGALDGGSPLFIMPAWLQTFSNVSIVKWAIVALEGAIWRGFDLGDMMLPCGVLVATGLVGFSIAALVVRWGEQR
jgi:hypothetical protein